MSGHEVFETMRSDLDEGYGTVGDFVDLAIAGLEYSHKELESRRDAVIRVRKFRFFFFL